ncbi:MAG: hypothetical protein Q8O91_07645 [Candidatus Aminicenantes bacterium]|nr:hypothetical protein [Candidatus Aminicenantes bacterium]
MGKEKIFKSKVAAFAIIFSFTLLFFPIEALSQRPITGILTGFIYYDEDMKSPVKNAVVIIKNLKTKVEFRSKASDISGLYIISNLEEGLYILGVHSPIGDFNFGYQIKIKANETAKLSLVLKKGKKGGAIVAGAAGAGVVAGATTTGVIAGAVGVGAAAGFFATPIGIAVAVVGATAAGYAGVKIAEAIASPSKR